LRRLASAEVVNAVGAEVAAEVDAVAAAVVVVAVAPPK
jgi:hypothetical protein